MEKILYGTDTPLYCTATQRIRINQEGISDDAKWPIPRENALQFLNL
ncbi:MAG: hypothetical protein ABI210_00875 [Abditibacteriaceae bacterium]